MSDRAYRFSLSATNDPNVVDLDISDADMALIDRARAITGETLNEFIVRSLEAALDREDPYWRHRVRVETL